jgi:hypothetical protein
MPFVLVLVFTASNDINDFRGCRLKTVCPMFYSIEYLSHTGSVHDSDDMRAKMEMCSLGPTTPSLMGGFSSSSDTFGYRLATTRTRTRTESLILQEPLRSASDTVWHLTYAGSSWIVRTCNEVEASGSPMAIWVGNGADVEITLRRARVSR